MKEQMKVEMFINDLPIEANYTKESVEEIFKPMLKHWTACAKKSEKRIVVFLAAPPAVGKSTLGHFLEKLSKQEGFIELQVLGLDGFHYHSEHIKKSSVWVDGIMRSMSEVKGCPESYDVVKLMEALKRIDKEGELWPIYSRSLHDVVENQILVDKKIVFIEGNWLLYNEEPWKRLSDYATDTIFIEGDPTILRKRLIQRKTMGGMEKEAAILFVDGSDMRNVELVSKNSLKAHWMLALKDGDFVLK